MLKPIAMFAAAGFIGVLLTKVLMLLLLPLVGMFVGFVFLMLKIVLVISLVDNFLKPIIISRGSHLPFILVFLGVLGGVLTFGFIGVFLGPTLLAVGYQVLNEWMRRAKPEEPEWPNL